jgi:hypothetical protein
MSDELQAVRDRFIEYSKEFNQKDPQILVPFFYFPSLLITPKIIGKPMTNEQDVLDVFTSFMALLKTQNFTRSKLHLDTLTEKILDDYSAIVSGVATRFKQDPATGEEVEMEKIGVTYTFRKSKDTDAEKEKEKDNVWKIITGVIHKPETAIAL